MVDINASMTDGTGKEIVEALRGLGGGSSSSGGDVVVLKTLPPINPDGDIRLDHTGNEILEAARGDKVILLCKHDGEMIDQDLTMAYYIYCFSRVDRATVAADNSNEYWFKFDLINQNLDDHVYFFCGSDLDTYPELTEEAIPEAH